MKATSLLIALMLVGATLAGAQGSRWRYVYVDSTRMVSIDRRVIRTTPGLYGLWVRIEYLRRPTTGSEAWDSGVRTRLDRSEIDCVKRMTRPLQYITYDSVGNVVASDTYQDPGRWSGVAPETIGEDYLDAACVIVADKKAVPTTKAKAK